MIEIKYGQLRKIAFVILALPFLVFSIGWLRWYWSIACSLALCTCIYFGVFRKKDNEYNNEKSIEISWATLFIIMGIVLIWTWQSGIGGFWTQSKDFRYRNAIFRDIVLRDWPVVYPATGHALVYYIGYWLVPALFGKAVLLLGAGNDTAFEVADSAMFVWTFLILMLLFLLIIYTLKLNGRKQQLFAILLFVFFSGADVIGNIGYSWDYIHYHFEWWATDYQFSSFTTCLFWVFNQALPAWLCFVCLINEKNIRNYVFIGMMCLFCAPLPFVGLFVYCVYYAIKKLIEYIKDKKVSKFFKDMFSMSNILCIALIFPVIGTYLLSNTVIHGSNSLRMNDSAMVMEEIQEIPADLQFSENPVINYISFICIEFALYMLFMAWKYKKSPVYYVTFGSLLIIPLLRIGGAQDFAMRASIPALIMVFLLVTKFLIEERNVLKTISPSKENEKSRKNSKVKDTASLKKLTYILLVVFLILGTLTPVMEFLRGFHEVSEYGIHNEKYDDIYTLGCDGPYDEPGKKKTYRNFVSVNPEEDLFFKVFAGK